VHAHPMVGATRSFVCRGDGALTTGQFSPARSTETTACAKPASRTASTTHGLEKMPNQPTGSKGKTVAPAAAPIRVLVSVTIAGLRPCYLGRALLV
jgi:hypothetical protein